MLTPERLLRVMIELIFVLLGALVAWLALRGRILVDRHGRMWLVLSIVLILWGLRALYKPGQDAAATRANALAFIEGWKAARGAQK